MAPKAKGRGRPKLGKKPAGLRKPAGLTANTQPPVALRKPAGLATGAQPPPKDLMTKACSSKTPAKKKPLPIKKDPGLLKRRPAGATPPASGREERRAEEAERRLEKFSHKYHPGAAQDGGVSTLERIVTLDTVEEDYFKRAALFNEWMREQRITAMDAHSMLMAFLDYLDHLFFEGADHNDGSKVFAALRAILKDVESDQVGIRRVQKALAGWHKRAPAGSREPTPLEGVGAILGDLLERKQVVISFAALLQFLTYLRPGELCGLLKHEVLLPVANTSGAEAIGLLLHGDPTRNPSKVGERDESLLVNDIGYRWLEQIMGSLVRDRPGEPPLWPFTQEEYCRQLRISAERMKIDDFAPYSLRHAGASHDLLSQRRTYEQVRARGRWKTEQSVRRYGKPAMTMRALGRMDPKIIEYGKAVIENLEGIWLGARGLPAYPLALGSSGF